MECLSQILPLRAQGVMLKRRQRDCRKSEGMSDSNEVVSSRHCKNDARNMTSQWLQQHAQGWTDSCQIWPWYRGGGEGHGLRSVTKLSEIDICLQRKKEISSSMKSHWVYCQIHLWWRSGPIKVWNLRGGRDWHNLRENSDGCLLLKKEYTSYPL